MDFNGGQLSSLVGCRININELDTGGRARRRLWLRRCRAVRLPQKPALSCFAGHQHGGRERRQLPLAAAPFLRLPPLRGTPFPTGKGRFEHAGPRPAEPGTSVQEAGSAPRGPFLQTGPRPAPVLGHAQLGLVSAPPRRAEIIGVSLAIGLFGSLVSGMC